MWAAFPRAYQPLRMSHRALFLAECQATMDRCIFTKLKIGLNRRICCPNLYICLNLSLSSDKARTLEGQKLLHRFRRSTFRQRILPSSHLPQSRSSQYTPDTMLCSIDSLSLCPHHRRTMPSGYIYSSRARLSTVQIPKPKALNPSLQTRRHRLSSQPSSNFHRNQKINLQKNPQGQSNGTHPLPNCPESSHPHPFPKLPERSLRPPSLHFRAWTTTPPLPSPRQSCPCTLGPPTPLLPNHRPMHGQAVYESGIDHQRSEMWRSMRLPHELPARKYLSFFPPISLVRIKAPY